MCIIRRNIATTSLAYILTHNKKNVVLFCFSVYGYATLRRHFQFNLVNCWKTRQKSN